MIWFTSDSHFGHRNVLSHDGRPFASIEEHDAALIRNWNNVVTDKDEVWHLGDFCFASPYPASWYRKQLRGRIHLVLGNHDEKKLKNSAAREPELFESIQYYKFLRYDNQKIILCHYSFRVWNGCHHGSWHLHGHSHGKLPRLGKSMDVSVNVNGYTPVSFDAVRGELQGRENIGH